MQIQEHINKNFIRNTYQSIKGRGIHLASCNIKKAIIKLRKNGAVHYLHTDIKKYYQSIDIDILMIKLNRFYSCAIIKSLIYQVLQGNQKTGNEKGVLIGYPISQILCNIYLDELDHYIMEIKGVRYFRYADDMIFLSNNKKKLKQIHKILKWHLKREYKLDFSRVKFGRLTETNALDTLGYKFYINRVAVRKHIKHKLSKAYHKNKRQVFMSLKCHCKYANSKKMINNLIKL